MTRTGADLLDELRAVDESVAIEAKTASKIDRSVLESVCAFANEPGLGGGYLLLGVRGVAQVGAKDAAVRVFEVVGVAEPDKLQADLASQCATAFNRPLRPRIDVDTLEGKTVLVVFVPELPAGDKPVFLTSLGLPRGAFRRIGSTDQESTEDDLLALYQGRQVDTFDATPVRDAEIADFDPEAIQLYRTLRKEANPLAEELTWNDADLLRALGATTKDGDVVRPTIAGLLLFGTAIVLRRCLPLARIDYIRVPGRTWIEDPDHRFDTVEIRAPLLLAARRAIATVRDDLPASFRLPEGALTRTDEPIVPLRVLREAIVNAVMHRSYRIHGSIQILRYANRIEIRNPGHSLKSDDQLGEPGSEARNPRIAAVMHDVNLAETKGSGIRTMRELMIQHDLAPPAFESSRRPDQFVATFLFHHFLGDGDLAWLRKLTTEKLSDENARALVLARELGAIDNATYRGINRTDTLQASAHLRRLRDLGILEMKGSGSRTYYVPSWDRALDPPQVSADSSQIEPYPPQPGLDPGRAGADLAQAGTDLAQVSADLTQVGADLAQVDLAHLPQDLRVAIAGASPRPRREQLRELIIKLCAWRPLTAQDIAKALGERNVRNLVRLHLSEMVDAGDLAYTIPEMPKHPDQRYVVPKVGTR